MILLCLFRPSTVDPHLGYTEGYAQIHVTNTLSDTIEKEVSTVKHIDVSDLPESVAQHLAEQAEHHRALARLRSGSHVKPLPQWPGIAVPPERLRREELYDDDE